VGIERLNEESFEVKYYRIFCMSLFYLKLLSLIKVLEFKPYLLVGIPIPVHFSQNLKKFGNGAFILVSKD
jgi:hypothetical protein